jgi:hypothetical protein
MMLAVHEDDEADAAGAGTARVLLGRAEVGALVDACGLGLYREAIVDAVLAGYRLEPGGDGRTRIGGLPDMADGEIWPHADNGIPYTLVAQVDCSTLPALTGDFTGPEWAHDGALVRIFAHLDARVPEPGTALALACAPDAAVARAALPPRPDPMPLSAWEPDDDSLRTLRETPVTPVAFLTVPEGWYVLAEDAREAPATVDAYRDFAARLSTRGAPHTPRRGGCQLLGHAVTMQDQDPRFAGPWLLRDEPRLRDLHAWRVLLNIDDGRYDRFATEPSMG